MKNEIIIVGAFHEIIELAEDLNISILGLIDNEKVGLYRNYPILATDATSNDLSPEIKEVPIVITPDGPALRMKLSVMYKKFGYTFSSLVAIGAKVSKSAFIGNGVIIQHGVNVSAQAEIADFVKLNTYCNVMHNSAVGKYTTIAPGAVILGNVQIGESCYIGANSTILPNISVCDNVVIGAGAVLTKDINQPGTYIGVPAKRMSPNKISEN
ncbi:DapH/DapD/GlmU-related protein [Pedobacter immunditicola]|uniref:DapH/DapD/GlmU-related protein n=1 Tax=Pedobacter immunditicola TaxID=3133440 RepID=UPI0030B7A5F5